MSRVSTAPNRESGLQLPVHPANGTYPSLGLGSTTNGAFRCTCVGNCRIHLTTELVGVLRDPV